MVSEENRKFKICMLVADWMMIIAHGTSHSNKEQEVFCVSCGRKGDPSEGFGGLERKFDPEHQLHQLGV